MDTKTFFIAASLCVILFVVVAIARNRIDNKPKKGSKRYFSIEYIDKFFSDNPNFVMTSEIKRIYKRSRKVILNSGGKEYADLLARTNCTATEGALNVLRQCTLNAIKSTTGAEILKADNNAIALYFAIMDKKLQLGYITQEQYDYDKMCFIKKTASPLRNNKKDVYTKSAKRQNIEEPKVPKAGVGNITHATQTKSAQNSEQDTIGGIPKSVKIYPLTPSPASASQLSDFSLELRYFSMAIINAKPLFRKNKYVIADILSIISFIVHYKFCNTLSDEEIESKIINDFLINTSSNLNRNMGCDADDISVLYKKRTEELKKKQYYEN
ncbi:MAG: hypothetical protein IKE65_06565 [Clostridia bacterium]|nr:hypothetical protein [Clostridia bacterium]